MVLLTGPSGSGKTTLLTLIAALRTLKSGTLEVFGKELRDAQPRVQGEIRKRIGFIFQAHNLLPHLNAIDNVRLALELQPHITAKEGRERAQSFLEAVGLGQRMLAYLAKLFRWAKTKGCDRPGTGRKSRVDPGR